MNSKLFSGVLVNNKRAKDRPMEIKLLETFFPSRRSSLFFFLLRRAPRPVIAFKEGSPNDDYESPIRVIGASWDSMVKESLGKNPGPRHRSPNNVGGHATANIAIHRGIGARGPGGSSRRKWKINMYSPTLQCLVTRRRSTRLLARDRLFLPSPRSVCRM